MVSKYLFYSHSYDEIKNLGICSLCSRIFSVNCLECTNSECLRCPESMIKELDKNGVSIGCKDCPEGWILKEGNILF